ncbi:hypothetical protein CBG25_20075, partial [Arsenophonus sp. ENCA]|uniref:hypothetical protein n=1 Tax=Arsenophonus sp. ENCA TaxID=1987579 RepID=UPI000BD33721
TIIHARFNSAIKTVQLIPKIQEEELFLNTTIWNYLKKPTYQGLRFFNKQSLEIKQIETNSIFKNILKDYLIQNPVYSFDGYFEG